MNLQDRHGRRVDVDALNGLQSTTVRQIECSPATWPVDTFTPMAAASLLKAADQGDIAGQHLLFDEMLASDGHLRGTYETRVAAVTALDWHVAPPAQPDAQDVALAQWVSQVLRHGIEDLPSLLANLMEAPGHGFAAAELEWQHLDGVWLPRLHPRPQSWFQVAAHDPVPIRLRDESREGVPLRPFSWIVHHGASATGYAARTGAFRALVWPWLYKRFTLGDFAEFLEGYGVPIVIGRYPNSAPEEEKASLLRAVSALGHGARAVLPADMSLEIQQPPYAESGAAHLALVEWADRAISKAILGHTEGATGLQTQVRRDVLMADAKSLAATLSRDLIYPLVALNAPAIAATRRRLRLQFELAVPRQMRTYADALPKLADMGMRIPVGWVHRKLQIPVAEAGDARFGKSATMLPPIE